MDRNDALKPLTHIVQVRETGGGGGQWWQTIAAFDCEKAARTYCNACPSAVDAYRVQSLPQVTA